MTKAEYFIKILGNSLKFRKLGLFIVLNYSMEKGNGYRITCFTVRE